MTLALSTEGLTNLRDINPYRFRPLSRVYGGDYPPQTGSASPVPQYIVKHGVTGMRLTKPVATSVEADAAAIRLSLDRSYIVEVWHRDR